MTKTIIDADALLRWIKATKGLFDDETLDGFYLSTLEKINELSTPDPVTQELNNDWRIGDRCIINIIGATLVAYAGFAFNKHKFIASETTTYTTSDLMDVENIDMKYRSLSAPVAQEGDGWCYDMLKAPQEFTVLIESDYGYAILHEVSWHNHDACPSTPEAFEHNLKCLADGYHKTGKIVAWRPQPPIPTMGDL